ncbi:T6SS immunity protein Tli3 family protein [Burkholderia cenocepacia]|uniref:T6SS immunity protein Tli3 family protein n=1 Tax=Burkholderia cenocepacia TaxID=95486 RepID=UPI000981D189|nr:hypothetical protein [Burkholderia cenocepacia]AQQ35498.1 hypothetical protein A8E96_25645 [Burkholderia cenocepacia]MBR8075105.1 hypothetical protein [Burkholderia cenocepacia]ONW29297.1 hypothetical protein A8E95_23895 [Burkholderia cenocepacia]
MVRNLVIVALMLLMQACSAQKPYSFNLADFLSAKELPYDSPPQVIYRLDDHRFVTLERYRDCYHGETFYNDTKTGIRRMLGRGTVENFQGRVINADPTGMNLVFPSAVAPYAVCGDRGCNPVMAYSTDGGNTFHGMVYARHIYKPFEDSKDYTVAVTSDKLFIAKKFQYRSDRPEYDLSVRQYTLAPSVDRNKPYQPIVESDGAWASKKKLMPDGLRTPSGQDRITCDASIKPTNPNAPLVR